MRYKLYQNCNKTSACYGKWYARGVHEKVTFNDFVKHMADHHCVYSEATIKGVLLEMEICLREMLLEGKAVYFDELGIFRIGLRTTPAASPKDFNSKLNVPGVRLNLYLGKRFRAAQMRKDLKLAETEKNTVGMDETEP